MAGVGNDHNIEVDDVEYNNYNSNQEQRPQHLAVNPVNIGLATVENVLSSNNARIVQRSEKSTVSNAAPRPKNDPTPTELNADEIPENYFGNGSGVRRPVIVSTPLMNTSPTVDVGLSTHVTCSRAGSIGSVDGDPTTEEILKNGLGLVLSSNTAATASSLTFKESQDMSVLSPPSPPTHNWQSDKHSVKARFEYLLNSGTLADVTFLVGGSSLLMSASALVLPTPERFSSHKFVLSMSSAVFDAMFNGQMAVRDGTVVEIPDVEPVAFAALLKFIYTDEIVVESDSVMSILYAAKKYAIPALEHECVEFLKDNIHSENVFMLLSQARLFDEPALAKMCLDAIDKSTSEAFSSDGFVDIDLDTLCVVLSRDSLGIRESALFCAVTKWAEHACVKQEMEITADNQRAVLEKAIRLIRYPLMTVEEFAVQV